MYDVKLISRTMPTEEFSKETDCETAEQLISYCARVSNPSNQDNFDTAGKLLKYCMKKKHWSIFTMVDLTFEINCTRDIGRQILRHDADFQEFSLRYAEPDINNFVIREFRIQDDKNRQNSIDFEQYTALGNWDTMTWDILESEWKSRQRAVADMCLDNYKWAISNKIAKEQARCVLPEGMTPSVMYMKNSLRNWYHYCQTRMYSDTQKEHRLIAQSIWNVLLEEFKFLKEIQEE